jgi:hypothetical protein
MTSFRTIGERKVQSMKCCVVFDPSDGVIRHVHRVVTMEGAAETQDDEVARKALTLAKERGLSVSELETLHVHPDALKPGSQYRVDVQTRALVATSGTEVRE